MKNLKNVYDWDMVIEDFDEFYGEFYTRGKIYEVRGGKVIVDKDYENSNVKYSLGEFLNKWGGNWNILSLKIEDSWYSKE